MLATLQNFLDQAKKSATDPLNTVSKREIQKSAEVISDLIVNKYSNRILKVSKNSQKSYLETVPNTHEHYKEIPKERYISPEKRQKMIDGLRII